MLGLIVKSLSLGLVAGGIITLIYSILTSSTNGRNAMTGEPMQLKGLYSILYHINEYGMISYLKSVAPIFIIILALVSVLLGSYFYSKNVMHNKAVNSDPVFVRFCVTRWRSNNNTKPAKYWAGYGSVMGQA